MDHLNNHLTNSPSPARHDWLRANKEYFDNLGAQFDQIPEAIPLAQSCTRAFLNAYPFKEGGETIIMDYACGTGLISKDLVPYAKTILGVDISQGMVDQYNLRTQSEGIPSEKMHAVCAELEGKEGELDNMKFDVIVCSSAYHHFESIEQVTKCIAYFMKPGGSLLITDFVEKRDHLEDVHRSIVPHAKGIDESQLKGAFEKASLESFTYRHAFTATWKGVPVTHFIATGTKNALIA